MEVNAEKNIREEGLSTEVQVSGQEVKVVRRFKYLGSVINCERPRKGIISRAAKAMAVVSKLGVSMESRNGRSHNGILPQADTGEHVTSSGVI